ncbi:MAG: hypothetical protein LQ351_004197 [Letrouitia transgressa]|nr:MAG: hypothetical protein LQ351_004197 [Letrouitia transgressa]
MIQEKNARWIYQAERELEDKEVRPVASSADYFNGWNTYPINIANQDDLIPSAASLNDRLTRLAKTLFSSTVDLHLIGIQSDGSITADTKPYHQETDVETAIRRDVLDPPRIRIV